MTGLFLWLEFLALFGLTPLLYALGWLPVPKIPLLLAIASVCFIYLAVNGFLRKTDIFVLMRESKRALRTIAFRTLAVALLSTLTVTVCLPDQLFGFPRARPLLWLAVMFLYPLLSAFPQEIVYRAFLFHRYVPILKTETARTWASVLAFSFLHIVFGGWVAVTLTIPAGYIFARTYRRTGSLFLASLEHAAYGCVVFTTGLGQFFHHPS
ncbi:CPBP family intramembrane metalloprotease [Pseudodesulfovibrio thermohalotolerans]|uniref:CPBP family intramembrane glutamic endopeptidase n=1 Tax=Pseudodesulfovibrio thermohalotolerans TaxID=2880651 RepID=UPI002441BC6E|nr:CPBP family intramembrane metalloprotease [Pseudodesulfovibrio thermohalotolerans]WFS64099.1 CPBP family intramembrane metalloprotease [Pseudodesulfovibrio thermohalotolerans]